MNKNKVGDRVIFMRKNNPFHHTGVVTGIQTSIDESISYFIKVEGETLMIDENLIIAKCNKGGKRQGAGRKKSDVPTLAIRLPVSLIERLDFLKSLDIVYSTFKQKCEGSNSPRVYFFKQFMEAVETHAKCTDRVTDLCTESLLSTDSADTE